MLLGVLLLFLLTTKINAHSCTEEFLSEARYRLKNITFCKRYMESNEVEVAMNLKEESRRLDVLVGAKLEKESGWLAWGLNPGPEARMIGTQALVGIKQKNAELIWDKYNVTSYTKLGCPLLPSSIDFNVTYFNFSYNGLLEYHLLRATIVLPSVYDVTRLNHVWQVGINVVGRELKMHPASLKNYDSTETLNLKTGQGRGDRVHRSARIRQAHGILNMIGWGILLPIGVIIARNFREAPISCNTWKYYHITCQAVGYIVGSTGWAVGMWLGAKSKYYSFPKHGTFGNFIFAFATLQMLFFKLSPGPQGMFAMYRNMFHHMVGYSLLVVSCINIYKGIKILYLDNKYWLLAYLGSAACLAFIFLVFEIVSWFKFLCDTFHLWILCGRGTPKKEASMSKNASKKESKVEPSATPENYQPGSVTQL